MMLQHDWRKCLVALAVASMAACGTPESQELGGTDSLSGGVVLINGSDIVSLPQTAVCNGVERGGVVITAEHCVADGRAVVVAPGRSACETASTFGALDFTGLSGQPGQPRHSDVAVATRYIGGHATAPVGVDHGDEVTVVGFGRRGGNGPFECGIQRLVARVASKDRCGTGEVGAGAICIVGVPLCAGFSGAPVFRGGAFVGVVTRGTACADRDGGVVVEVVPPLESGAGQ